eukprot:7703089-Alexandrium_andersonii.AAC.1
MPRGARAPPLPPAGSLRPPARPLWARARPTPLQGHPARLGGSWWPGDLGGRTAVGCCRELPAGCRPPGLRSPPS